MACGREAISLSSLQVEAAGDCKPRSRTRQLASNVVSTSAAHYVLCTPHARSSSEEIRCQYRVCYAKARSSMISQEEWATQACYNCRDGWSFWSNMGRAHRFRRLANRSRSLARQFLSRGLLRLRCMSACSSYLALESPRSAILFLHTILERASGPCCIKICNPA